MESMDLFALEGRTLPATKERQGMPRNLSYKPTEEPRPTIYNGLQAGGTSGPLRAADITSSQVQRWREPRDALEPSLLSPRTCFLHSQVVTLPFQLLAKQLGRFEHTGETGRNVSDIGDISDLRLPNIFL